MLSKTNSTAASKFRHPLMPVDLHNWQVPSIKHLRTCMVISWVKQDIKNGRWTDGPILGKLRQLIITVSTHLSTNLSPFIAGTAAEHGNSKLNRIEAWVAVFWNSLVNSFMQINNTRFKAMITRWNAYERAEFLVFRALVHLELPINRKLIWRSTLRSSFAAWIIWWWGLTSLD